MTARPAQPVLASTLYTSTSRSTTNPLPSRKRRRVGGFGIESLDRDVLKGGFVEEGKGGLVGLAVERGAAGNVDGQVSRLFVNFWLFSRV